MILDIFLKEGKLDQTTEFSDAATVTRSEKQVRTPTNLKRHIELDK